MSTDNLYQATPTEILDAIEDLDREDLLYLLRELEAAADKNNITLRVMDRGI